LLEPGIQARIPIVLGAAAVSHTFTVAHGLRTSARALTGTSTVATRTVMIVARGRSTRMSAALTMATPLNTATESFDALYRDCARDLYAYVRTLLGDDAGAEDVTALAFERAYRRRASFDARRGSRRCWLFGIARNAALDELRRRKRSAPLIGDLPDESAAAPDEEAELAVRRATVRAALAGLAPRERELVALKFHGGLSNAELAIVLGVSESNAGTRVHRAVMKLREACNAPS
jgi:RNA polymerase sigma-70 factor (ECF subfamily)